MRENPTKLVYVGHNGQGSSMTRTSTLAYLLQTPPKRQLNFTNFVGQYRDSCQRNYALSVANVLNETTTMAQIFDVEFMIPPLADAVARAEKLSRNDYLMTVLVLLSCMDGESQLGNVTKRKFLTQLQYNRYRFKKGMRRESSYYNLFLGEQMIAMFVVGDGTSFG